MRAILVGVLYRLAASLQATMLTSSLCVTANNISTSAIPACSSTEGWDAFPTRVRRSKRSCSRRNFSASVSTMVISLSSPTKLSATVEPTCPAPSINICTSIAFQDAQLFHLIEQPMLAICSSGPLPVCATCTMALNKSRGLSGTASLREASSRPRYCNSS